MPREGLRGPEEDVMQGRQQGTAARRPRPMTSTAMARQPSQGVAAYSNAGQITAALAQAAKEANLVSPSTVVGSLPMGSEVVLSAVMIDARDLRDGGDCYKLSGKLGLGKTALDRIAAAAGVSWDPNQTRRLDNGSDPHYCHFRAVGHVQDLDGTVRTISGEVEMDAREGSPQVEEITSKAKSAGRDPSNQIRELRKFLIRHAESKAKNRAIRSLGVKTAYEPRDLEKPFQVAKLMWTGRTGDRELDRDIALRTLELRMGAQSSLYGDRTAAEVPRAALPPASAGHAPPPIGDVYDVDTDDDPSMGDWHGAGEVQQPTTPPPAQERQQAPPRREAQRPAERDDQGGPAIDTTQVAMPGKKPTPMVSEASDDDLEFWRGVLEKNIEDPSKANYRDANIEKLAAIEAEQGYRAAESGGGY